MVLVNQAAHPENMLPPFNKPSLGHLIQQLCLCPMDTHNIWDDVTIYLLEKYNWVRLKTANAAQS